MVIKVVCWRLGILIAFNNIISIAKYLIQYYNSDTLKDYDRYVTLINFWDLITGFCLLSIIVKDTIVADSYAESDIMWRGGIPCHCVAFLSLWSIMVQGLFMMAVRKARYRVVKYPFEKPFGTKCTILITVIMPLIFIILIIIVILLRHQVEGFSNLSSPLCILLEKQINQ